MTKKYLAAVILGTLALNFGSVGFSSVAYACPGKKCCKGKKNCKLGKKCKLKDCDGDCDKSDKKEEAKEEKTES